MYMCAIPQSKKMGKIFVFSMFEQHIRTQSISEIAGRVARKMALASYEDKDTVGPSHVWVTNKGTRTLWGHLIYCTHLFRSQGQSTLSTLFHLEIISSLCT